MSTAWSSPAPRATHATGASPAVLQIAGASLARAGGVVGAVAWPILGLGAAGALLFFGLILSFGDPLPRGILMTAWGVAGLGVIGGAATFLSTRTRAALEVTADELRLRLPDMTAWTLPREAAETIAVGGGEPLMPSFFRVLPHSGRPNVAVLFTHPRPRPRSNGLSPACTALVVGPPIVQGAHLRLVDPDRARRVLLAHGWPIGTITEQVRLQRRLDRVTVTRGQVVGAALMLLALLVKASEHLWA